MNKKKIVLITTGQPSVNPRIVKEADALYSNGYDVIILYCFFIQWASEKDALLLSKIPWSYKMAGGCPAKNKWLYLFTRIRRKAVSLLSRYIGNSLLLAERTEARAYDELIKEAKNIKADWYIAHNLGALPIAVKAAAYHKSKAGFDFEDYHRGEVPVDSVSRKRISFLEKKYIHSLTYISASSPMILNAVLKDFPAIHIPVVTINNCFPQKQQPAFRHKSIKDNHLRLFWFSQTIGINRGLETLIQAMVKNNDPLISVTLAGRCNEDMLTYINLYSGSARKLINFAGIIQPEELPDFASQFDVGLALETGFSENNNIALSNKIFTYLLAGNALILSETPMQAAFNVTYKVGQSFPVNDVQDLAKKINAYKDVEKLNVQRVYNYKLARDKLNWEKESRKFLAMIS